MNNRHKRKWLRITTTGNQKWSTATSLLIKDLNIANLIYGKRMQQGNGVPFMREVKAICDKVHGQDPNHLVERPMMHKLKEYNLLWHNMSADVKHSIKSCTLCFAGRRESDQVVRTNHTIPCKRPFELFQADLLTLSEEHGLELPIKYLSSSTASHDMSG
jgi:hypothetical protein